MTQLSRQARTGVWWLMTEKLAGDGVRVLITIILARLLSPQHFGLIAAALLFMVLLENMLLRGTLGPVVQRKHIDETYLSTAFWTVASAGTGLCVLLALLAPGIAHALAMEAVTPIIWALIPVLFLAAFESVPRALLTRELHFRTIALATLISTMLGGTVGIAIAWLGWGVWSLVLYRFVAACLRTSLLWRRCQWRPRFTWQKADFNAFTRFGSQEAGSTVVRQLGRRIVHALIAVAHGPAALGLYFVPEQCIREAIMLFSGIPNRVALPAFARVQQRTEQLQSIRTTAATTVLCMAIPTALTIAILAPTLVPALFGDAWLASIPVLRTLAPLIIIIPLTQFHLSLLTATGKPFLRFLLITFEVGLRTLVTLLVLTQGIGNIAIANVLVDSVALVLVLGVVHAVLRLEAKQLLRTLGSLFMAGCIFAVTLLAILAIPDAQQQSILFCCLAVLVAGAAYGIWLACTTPSVLSNVRRALAR